MENKVEEIVSMLAESLNDRKVAVENFGNIAFAKKNIDGKTLKLLARKYKDAYQKWIDVLSEVDDEVCAAWDNYIDPVQKLIREATPDLLAQYGLQRMGKQE